MHHCSQLKTTGVKSKAFRVAAQTVTRSKSALMGLFGRVT